MIGILSEMILSKEIFQKNSDIDEFITNVFDISFKHYVYKSRTLIVAKTTRIIYNTEEIYKYQKNVYSYINKKIELYQDLKNKSDKNTFDGWI
ncbi:hypothetical protein [Peptostreptococcus sp. D1]|uniref:hypothetical protein n=1 Tax=Peptostreptococcus sp. D1 TaxID=72304 RepID=UPI00116096CB|nr:hypothetical protein [Peptostreptococcus sp. D1]